MASKLKHCWARICSERHILIRGTRAVRHLRIPGWVPVAGLVAATAGAVAVVHLGATYIEGSRILSFLKVEVALTQAAVENIENSNADLREHVALLESRLAAAKRELSDARGRLAQAAAQNSTLRGQLYTAELKLRSLEQQRDDAQHRVLAAEDAFAAKSAELDELARAIETTTRHGDTQRTVLAGRLKLLESEKDAAARHVAQMKVALAAAEKKAQLAVAERNRMRTQVAQIETGRGVEKSSVATMIAADGPDEGKASGGWAEIERLLDSVGVDVAGLMAKFNAPAAQGGPFVALDPRGRNAGGQVPLENLQKMLKSLPLALPLENYRLESRFGIRRDPFNRRQAMHAGLDFAAPYRTPVYTTAPGTVIYAGGKGEYGRVVEVDHGHGIMTRYAHLHRTSVVKGQRLTGREQIGQLGSSGRSSGPHLHYEILVNGVAQDPERFIEAGRNANQVTAVKY
jgi:murein DD-endopeptidase MepM/ murein hydrolase activator NlpD